MDRLATRWLINHDLKHLVRNGERNGSWLGNELAAANKRLCVITGLKELATPLDYERKSLGFLQVQFVYRLYLSICNPMKKAQWATHQLHFTQAQ